MKVLCYGSFLTVLVYNQAHSSTQKVLCGIMLLSINPDDDRREDDGFASALARCKSNLPDAILANAWNADPEKIVKHFKDKVLPLLDSNKKAAVVAALKDIIAADENIRDDTEVELVNKIKKADLVKRQHFVFEEFLAGVFLYTCITPKNKGNNQSKKELTDEYLSSFDIKDTDIIFISEHTKIDTTYGKEIAINSDVSVEQSKPSVITDGTTIHIKFDKTGKIIDDDRSTRLAILHWYSSANKKAVVIFEDERESIMKDKIKECEKKFASGAFDSDTENCFINCNTALKAYINDYKKVAIIRLFDDINFFDYVNGNLMMTNEKNNGPSVYYNIIESIVIFSSYEFHIKINSESFHNEYYEIDCYYKNLFKFTTQIRKDSFPSKFADCPSILTMNIYGVLDLSFNIIIENVASDYYLSLARYQVNQPEKFNKIKEKLLNTSFLNYHIGNH